MSSDLDDLQERLERATVQLDGLIASAHKAFGPPESELIRLRGKREGVQLALSYLYEEKRRVQA